MYRRAVKEADRTDPDSLPVDVIYHFEPLPGAY